MCRLLFYIIFNFLRILYNRLLYGSRYRVHWLQRIDPFANISLFQKGKLRIERNIELASGCDLQVHGDGELMIGEGTYMNRYCMISVHDSVSIGNRCMFGPSVKIFDNNHRFTKDKGVSSQLSTASIVIGSNCWIASNVIILKGATIGDNCVIGAGCVITGNIPSGSIVKVKQEQIIDVIR